MVAVSRSLSKSVAVAVVLSEAAVVLAVSFAVLQRGDGAVAQLADHGGQLAQLLVGQVTGAGGGVERGGETGLGLLGHDFSSG